MGGNGAITVTVIKHDRKQLPVSLAERLLLKADETLLETRIVDSVRAFPRKTLKKSSHHFSLPKRTVTDWDSQSGKRLPALTVVKYSPKTRRKAEPCSDFFCRLEQNIKDGSDRYMKYWVLVVDDDRLVNEL